MFNVSEYLKKFSRIESQSREVNNIIIKAFCSVLGQDIGQKISFSVKKGVINIKGNMAKSAVFMKKAAILSEIKKTNTDIFDIK